MEAVLRIADTDNLVTCLKDISKGEEIRIDGEVLVAAADIPQFHKIALTDIPKGEPCRKYGQIVGVASADIKKGDYVHVHNCESVRGRGDRA